MEPITGIGKRLRQVLCSYPNGGEDRRDRLPLCQNRILRPRRRSSQDLRYSSHTARSGLGLARVARLFVWPRHANGMFSTTPLDPCACEMSAQGGNKRRTGPLRVGMVALHQRPRAVRVPVAHLCGGTRGAAVAGVSAASGAAVTRDRAGAIEEHALYRAPEAGTLRAALGFRSHGSHAHTPDTSVENETGATPRNKSDLGVEKHQVSYQNISDACAHACASLVLCYEIRVFPPHPKSTSPRHLLTALCDRAGDGGVARMWSWCGMCARLRQASMSPSGR